MAKIENVKYFKVKKNIQNEMDGEDKDKKCVEGHWSNFILTN